MVSKIKDFCIEYEFPILSFFIVGISFCFYFQLLNQLLPLYIGVLCTIFNWVTMRVGIIEIGVSINKTRTRTLYMLIEEANREIYKLEKRIDKRENLNNDK